MRRRALRYFRPYRRQCALVAAGLAAGAALGLVPAAVTKTLIDELTAPGASLGLVALLVGISVVAALIAGLVGLADAYLRTVISQGVMLDIRTELFDRLLDRSVSEVTDRRSGDLLSRMSNDVAAVEGVIADTTFGLVETAVVGIVTAAFLLALDWRLMILIFVLLPAFTVPARVAGARSYRARHAIYEKLSEITSSIHEVLGISGILLAKAFGAKGRERRRLRFLHEELRDLAIRDRIIGSSFTVAMRVLAALGPGLLWLAGGYLVLEGQASVGTVVAFVAVLTPRLAGTVGEVGRLHIDVVASTAVFERIFDELDREPSITEAPDSVTLDDPVGSVSFEGVTFAYGQHLAPALDDVSFAVEPGQMVALVGPSGAGKSTITWLLSRFHDPQSGVVRIDGHDVRTLTLDSLGAAIGMVFQESFLFHSSIRDNLLYARPEATQAQLEEAARMAHIDGFIAALPDGYDTVVGERGHRLSGGEKQRLAIAQVILKDPRIFVLDEATSHLDSVSEELIRASLGSLMAGRTSLVIAHRLSTVLAADVILVLDRGRIVERGTHEALVARGGLYSQLFERQFLSPPPSPSVSSRP